MQAQTLHPDDPPPASMRWRHLLLNALVFGLCYLAAQHAGGQGPGPRPHWATAWDAQVPWWPWAIVPYMSAGPLLAASFACVPTVDSLRLLSQRLLLATVCACLVFLAWPLHFSLPRPPLDAASLWTGWMYELLGALDSPGNQLPSLHVAYVVILWTALRQCPRLRPALPRALLAIWLTSVAAATLPTYQHHLPDVGAGLALGLLCVAGIRPGRATQPWVSFHYAIAAGVWWIVAWAWGTWWLAFYGSASLLLVARAYATSDAGFLRKRGGRHPWSSRLLHAPYLFGYWLTWQAVRWRERGRPAWEIRGERLWVGRRLTSAQAAQLPADCAVIDLANELGETPQLRGGSHRYHHVPMLDLVPPDPAAVARVLHLLDTELGAGRTVFLHCAMGYARSRQLAAAHEARGKAGAG